MIYVGLGDNNNAIAWLEKADAGERGVYLMHLKAEPPWDPLRSDRRFRELLRRISFPGS